MKIVVNGASIAGLSVAVSLGRSGHDVVLIERAGAVRSGGIAVDVRGQALDVAQSFGILDQLKTNRVTYGAQFEFADPDGVVLASIDPNADIYESPGDLEVGRDELVRILESQLPASVTRLFDATVESLEFTAGGGARVSITGRDPEEVDLVVGADGLHSRIRRLAFGPEADYLRYLGLYVGVLRKCRTSIDVPATTVYNEPGKLVLVRGNGRESSAVLGFSSDWISYDYHDDAVGRDLVESAFVEVNGWKTQELISEVAESPDFYFDSVCQVDMPAWHRNACVLVGDAGYCASFFSGMGTTLALQGAKVLADSLNSEACVSAGLRAYEVAMRPFVDEAQATATEGIELLFPDTWHDIETRNRRLSPIRPASAP